MLGQRMSYEYEVCLFGTASAVCVLRQSMSYEYEVCLFARRQQCVC